MILHRPELFQRKPNLILLDLDNTLYEYAPCHAAGMEAAQAVAEENLNIAKADFERHYAEARAEIKARIKGQAASHNRLLYFQRALERAGFACEVRTALQLEKAYWCAYLDRIKLFEFVHDFLDDLRIAEIPVMIVTDLTAAIQYRKVLLLGLDGVIDGIITSEGSGSDKPAPPSFQIATERVSGAAKGSIWMIGDNPESDLVGAKHAVGAITLQKVHAGVQRAADTSSIDGTFESFAEIRELVRRLSTEDRRQPRDTVVRV